MVQRLTLLMVLGVWFAVPSTALAQQDTAPGPGAATGESHLFIGATARSVPAGHGYYSLREFSFGSFQVGITDRFSIGAGTVIFYPKAVVFTPKYQVYRSETLSAAVGVAHITQFQREGFGAAYVAVTKEYHSGSITGGGGLMYARSRGGSGGTPVVMIGGERRVSPRLEVVTENYVIFAAGAMTSLGVRVRKGRFTSEFGTVVPIAPGLSLPFPIINFGYSF